MSAWRRFAASGAARVLPIVGACDARAIDAFDAHPDIERVRTPRHATVLLLAGRLPQRLHAPLQRLHDQIPHPRAVVRWGGRALRAFPEAVRVESDADLAARTLEVARAVIEGRQASSAALLPDEPPVPWRGRGEHGQGGEGMMGGTPYGRPLAMTAPDVRDGLALDAMPLHLGPCLPGLPLGLELRLTLQGDVVQEASIEAPPLATSADAVFERALREPVMVADLERARAAHHLRHIAEWLRLCGAAAPALCASRLAADPTPAGFRRLRIAVRASGALRGIAPGLGRLSGEDASRFGGPTARAAGASDDARADSSVYRELGFDPVSQTGADVRTRLRQRLLEAEQAIALVVGAGACAARVGPLARVEAPDGAIERTGARDDASDDAALAAVARRLAGLEWGDALLVLASLPLARARVRARRSAARSGDS